MQINANDIRVGNIIDHENRLWLVLKTMHTQPGKGGAYMQVEMKDIKSGTKTNIRYRSSESVSKAALEPRDYQVLYVENGVIALMDQETYEQIEISVDLVNEDQRPFITGGMSIVVEFYDDVAIIVRLPATVVATVQECESTIKGQTASSSYKPGLLENGVRVMIPPFVSQGDKIVVKVESAEYVERAK